MTPSTELIGDAGAAGVTVVIASHEAGFVERLAERAVTVTGGRVTGRRSLAPPSSPANRLPTRLPPRPSPGWPPTAQPTTSGAPPTRPGPPTRTAPALRWGSPPEGLPGNARPGRWPMWRDATAGGGQGPPHRGEVPGGTVPGGAVRDRRPGVVRFCARARPGAHGQGRARALLGGGPVLYGAGRPAERVGGVGGRGPGRTPTVGAGSGRPVPGQVGGGGRPAGRCWRSSWGPASCCSTGPGSRCPG